MLCIHRSKTPIAHQYTMLNQTLEVVYLQANLRITITETINWKTHNLNVKNKANKTLGFIKRNLHSCPDIIKAQAYSIHHWLDPHKNMLVHHGTPKEYTK